MVLSFIAGLFGGGILGTALSNVTARNNRFLLRNDPVNLHGPGSYADALRIDQITESQYLEYMAELGFSKNQATLFYSNTHDFLQKEDLGIRRVAKSQEEVMDFYDKTPDGQFNTDALGAIKEEFCKGMYRNGYGKDEAERVFESLRPVPTFSILLEWLAKEVFEPEVRKRFKLDEDYPKIWASLMEALKVPNNEATAYWASHWNHPAQGQIGDMFTRFRSDRSNRSVEDAEGAGVTVDDITMTKDDYTEALKLHEIAPFWRDRLIATSYNPIPFSTLQSMYAFGLKPDAWFKGRLEDYGYSSGNSEIILDFWRRKFPYSSKAPIEDNITARLERGEITEDTALGLLDDADVPPGTAQFIVSKAMDKLFLKREKNKISAWTQLYKKQLKTKDELFQIIKQSTNNDDRAFTIANIIADKIDGTYVRVRIRDVGRGYKDGTISRDLARKKLINLRMLDDDLDFFLDIFAPDAEEPDEESG